MKNWRHRGPLAYEIWRRFANNGRRRELQVRHITDVYSLFQSEILINIRKMRFGLSGF